MLLLEPKCFSVPKGKREQGQVEMSCRHIGQDAWVTRNMLKFLLRLQYCFWDYGGRKGWLRERNFCRKDEAISGVVMFPFSLQPAQSSPSSCHPCSSCSLGCELERGFC